MMRLSGSIRLCVSIRHSPPVLGVALRLPFHLQHLAKTAGDGAALQSNLAVIRTVDIAHQHVHRRVVPVIGHTEHLVKRARPRQERQQSPQRAAAERGAPDALVLPWPGNFDHRYARANVDEEIGIDVGRRVGELSELHRIAVAVVEDFAGDLGDEEIET